MAVESCQRAALTTCSFHRFCPTQPMTLPLSGVEVRVRIRPRDSCYGKVLLGGQLLWGEKLLNKVRGLSRAEGSATQLWEEPCQLCASVSSSVREGVRGLTSESALHRALKGCCARPGAWAPGASRVVQEAASMWVRHRDEATSSPPSLSPIRHRALRRAVGSPELWWWTWAGGFRPYPGLGTNALGRSHEKSLGSGDSGLCWPKPVTSEFVSKIATCRWGPHTLSLPLPPCTCSRPSWEHSRPQRSCLLCALCLVLCPQMAVGFPCSSGLSSNMGSVRLTLTAQLGITPHLLFQSLTP